MKKLLVTLLSSLIICTSTVTITVPPLITEAHSGRTDRYGGHKDNKNVSGLGYYHYHCGGNPAHLHENGICPYADSDAGVANVPAANSVNNNSAANRSDSRQSSAPVATANRTSTLSQSVTISDTSYDNIAFNASYYANKHQDVYSSCGDNAKALYDHFMNSGMAEGRQSSEQFNISVYKANNQDLADAFGDDLMKYYNHFIESGCNENRVAR